VKQTGMAVTEQGKARVEKQKTKEQEQFEKYLKDRTAATERLAM
jgi:hypothetical protein